MQETTFLTKSDENANAARAKYSQLLNNEQGSAMLLTMIALSLLTMFSSYLFLSSVEDLRISDNNESMIQARLAARAGIEHARVSMKGLKFNDLLKGPNGSYDNGSSYLSLARTASFRNWADWSTLRSLNILDPSAAVASIPDDGLLNTGKVGTTPGTKIIPETGHAFTIANPYGTGTLTTARYFVKVTDNNGETSELAKDGTNNPFVDGDGTIIVRSIGVAGTVAEGAGANAHRNSVAIYEARFQQSSTFANLGSPVVVIGNNIRANFSGNAFDINGTNEGPGIGVVDTNPNDSFHPDQILRTATAGKGTITGNCTGAGANQCIGDITASVTSNPAKSNLINPDWLYNFVQIQAPAMRDYYIPNGGSLDSSNVGTPSNPKVTLCEYSCSGAGNISGAGLLIVRGDLTLGGSLRWDGLVLVIGKGEFWTHGMNRGIFGGLIVAGVTYDNNTGHAHFTDANTDFDIRGNSNIASYDGSLTALGNSMIAVKQVSFREVPNGIDP